MRAAQRNRPLPRCARWGTATPFSSHIPSGHPPAAASDESLNGGFGRILRALAQDSRPQRAKSLHSLWTPTARMNRDGRRAGSFRPRTSDMRRSRFTRGGAHQSERGICCLEQIPSRERSRYALRAAEDIGIAPLAIHSRRRTPKRARRRGYLEIGGSDSTRRKSRALKLRAQACISLRKIPRPSASTSSFCAKESRKCVSRWLNTFPGIMRTLFAMAFSTNCVAVRLSRLGTSTNP